MMFPAAESVCRAIGGFAVALYEQAHDVICIRRYKVTPVEGKDPQEQMI